MRTLFKLANTDIQNLLSWVAANRALKVGPGKKPLNCTNSGLVKMKLVAAIQKQTKIKSPISSNFQPKVRLPKTAFSPTCLGSLYMNLLIDFNDFFPCIWLGQITIAELVNAAHFIYSLYYKLIFHKIISRHGGV